jgi:hypothetical protein
MLSAPTIPVTPPDLLDKAAPTIPVTPPDLHEEAAMPEHHVLEELAETLPNPTIPVVMTLPDLDSILHAEAAIAHQMLEEFADELPMIPIAAAIAHQMLEEFADELPNPMISVAIVPPDLHDEAAMTEHQVLEEFAEELPHPTIKRSRRE